MDITNSAAYHGDGFTPREGGTYVSYDCPWELHTAALFLPTIDLDTQYSFTHGEHLHVEHMDMYKTHTELVNYKRTLMEHDVTVHQHNLSPQSYDGMYASDLAIGVNGDVLIGRMASEERAGEEQEATEFCYDNTFSPWMPFESDAVFEASDLIPVKKDIWLCGKGKRTNAKAISTLKNVLPFTTLVTVPISSDVQHLMGAVRIAAEDLVFVRPEHVDTGLFKPLFDTVVEVPESDEVVEDEAFNFVVTSERSVIAPSDTPHMHSLLEEYGCTVDTVQCRELRKGGGALACATMRLE